MPDNEESPQHSSEFVQSLQRGLAVITAFDADNAMLSLSDVARRTGLSRATARRFLHTLVSLGYVREDSGQFSLRPAVLRLGFAYLSGLSLPEVARPHMEELTARIHHSTAAAVLDEDSIVYVARVAARRIMTARIDVGTRFPAYATATGRVLLAHAPLNALKTYLSGVDFVQVTDRTVHTREHLLHVLEGVRRDGFALVDQELEVGVRSLAVPLRDRNANVTAALTTSTHANIGSSEDLIADLLPHLQKTAAAIESDLFNEH